MKTYFVLFALFFSLTFLFAKELNFPINLRLNHPVYQDGLLSTINGGMVSGENFTLQAKTVIYTKKYVKDELIHTLYAKDDLMLDYQGQIFLGSEFSYNFKTHEGLLIDGKTHTRIWYIQGEKIYFHQDKSCDILQAKVTTSDISVSEWEMSSRKMTLTQNKYLSSKDIKITFLKVPIFWIPGFKCYLNSFSDSFARYSIKWVSGQGPQLGFKYKIYSGENFETLLRIQYLYARGPSAALETSFRSDNNSTVFKSKNYYAHDTFYRDNDPNKRKTRFRLQGTFSSHNFNEKASVTAAYDKISDKNLPSDFPSEDFEFNSAHQTQLNAKYYQNYFMTGLNIKPRINGFEGFKQELPQLNFSIKPLKIAQTPLILENRFNLSFYDYVYTNLLNDAPKIYQNVLEDFHSLRASTHQTLYASLNQNGFYLTPYTGFIGIIYGNSPTRESVYQSLFTYGAKTTLKLERKFTRLSHKIEPYIHFEGFSKPAQSSSHIYIFDINDGFHSLNMARLGIFQTLFFKKFQTYRPNLTLDIFSLGFFNDRTYRKTFPKAGFEAMFQTHSLDFKTLFQWNFNNNVLDVCNTQLGCTISPNIAFKVEFRHRSKYYFRKENYDNYIIESARSLANLLDSPMSDGRNTLLSKLEIKLLPTCSLQLQTQSGWGRKNQKNYNEAKLDIYTMLTSSWKLRLSYTHTTRADIFTCGINLVKK